MTCKSREREAVRERLLTFVMGGKLTGLQGMSLRRRGIWNTRSHEEVLSTEDFHTEFAPTPFVWLVLENHVGELLPSSSWLWLLWGFLHRACVNLHSYGKWESPLWDDTRNLLKTGKEFNPLQFLLLLFITILLLFHYFVNGVPTPLLNISSQQPWEVRRFSLDKTVGMRWRRPSELHGWTKGFWTKNSSCKHYSGFHHHTVNMQQTCGPLNLLVV